MKFDEYVTFTRRVQALITASTGAAATLRRGTGRDSSEQPEAFGLLIPLLPEGCSRTDQDVCFTIANLMALTHRTPTQQKLSLGGALKGADRKRRMSGTDPASNLERRLISLARETDLTRVRTLHLPRLLTQIISANAPAPDWAQLAADLAGWNYRQQDITARWLRDYHRPTPTAAPADTTTSTETESHA